MSRNEAKDYAEFKEESLKQIKLDGRVDGDLDGAGMANRLFARHSLQLGIVEGVTEAASRSVWRARYRNTAIGH